jgi:pyruvate ferredoxin oxidoreductase beta subunit
MTVKLPPLKKLTRYPGKLASGHRLCAGCGASIIIRQVYMVASALGYEVVWANATGCLEMCTSIYPYTSWKSPWIHSAFENSAATISGVESAYKALVRKGKLPKDRKVKFIAIGGDGGTYDIGFQSLSGALERGHNFIYLCYDNEAYMNTGIQRSSATPKYANTTTQPVGSRSAGKPQRKKWLPEIAALHGAVYVAQVAPSHWKDLMEKVKKAFLAEGPCFINAFSACPRGWRFREEKSILITKLAVETNYWPLFEVENGRWRITYRPKKPKPVVEYLKLQGRFSHLFKPEMEEKLKEIQEEVDRRWNWLNRMEKLTGESDAEP